jgi:hypothetical protein
MRIAALLTMISLSLNSFAANECAARSVSSGPRQTLLIELYTSEGCSSCPPADHWVSGLPAAGFGPQQVVALAFHVDYWDYIGWKDRFANASFSERQHLRAAQTGGSYVYTPQLMLNGQDWHGGNYGALHAAIGEAAPVQARIKLQTQASDRGVNAALEVAFPGAQRGDAVYVALFENKLSSQVSAGENNGAFLRHDKVVRKLAGPYALDAMGKLNQQISLDYASGQLSRNSGVAAWIENSRSGRVAQAVATSCDDKEGNS